MNLSGKTRLKYFIWKTQINFFHLTQINFFYLGLSTIRKVAAGSAITNQHTPALQRYHGCDGDENA